MASSSVAGPSATTPASSLALLSNLPISHPSFISLLQAHTPLASSSALPHQALNKLLGRINTAVLSRENDNERRIAWGLAQEVIAQDVEGYALVQYGKAWVTASIGAVTATGKPSSSAAAPAHLLTTLITSASAYPSFEREAIHPVMGKIAVSLSRLLERTVLEGDWNSLIDILESVRLVLEHSPAPFRPVAPNMRALLRAITVCLPAPAVIPGASHDIIVAPLPVRQASASLLAALSVTAGKAQSPAAWGVAVRESLGGIGEALNGLARDGWEEEPVKITPPAVPAGLPALPADPATRLSPSLDWLEGFTEEALALLRYPTNRPVPIPIAQIVSSGLRCLNLTLDTPTVAYISPAHHAALLAALPRIWTVGLLLLAGVAAATGDHLLPHLSSILDHSVWLAERTPMTMHQTHLQLLHFHHAMFTLFPPALSPVDYPTRVLRFCLARYSTLLDSKIASSTPSSAVNGSSGKRGKKRARGAEDGLIGGLEGRESRAVSSQTTEILLAAFKVAALLHPTPLLASALLTFSIRLHLTLYLHLMAISASTFQVSSDLARLRNGVRDVLEAALYIVEGEQGTGRSWKSAILSVLETSGDKVALLLHPSAPPQHRPQPPLSALHFFTKETDEERKLRRELGYSAVGDEALAEDDDPGMVLDDIAQAVRPAAPVSATPVAVPTVFAQPAVAQPIVAAAPAAATTITTTSEQTRTVAVEPTPVVATTVVTTQESEQRTEVSEPFMTTLSSAPTVSRVEKVTETVVESMDTDDGDDEPIPDLDSGSSDEEDDEDEDDEEEEDEIVVEQ